MLGSLNAKFKEYSYAADGALIVSFAVGRPDIMTGRSTVAAIQKAAQNGKERLKIDIAEYREKRSNDANAYFHLLVGKIAKVLNMGEDECKRQMNLEYGTMEVEPDGMPGYFLVPKGADPLKKASYPKWIGERVFNGFVFDVYISYKKTHELDTKEMAQLIDGVVYEAKELGIETRTPEQIADMLSAWKTAPINKEDK